MVAGDSPVAVDEAGLKEVGGERDIPPSVGEKLLIDGVGGCARNWLALLYLLLCSNPCRPESHQAIYVIERVGLWIAVYS